MSSNLDHALARKNYTHVEVIFNSKYDKCHSISHTKKSLSYMKWCAKAYMWKSYRIKGGFMGKWYENSEITGAGQRALDGHITHILEFFKFATLYLT